MTEDANVPNWLKDIDLGRSLENLLMGSVLFVGRFFQTYTHIIAKRKSVQEEVLTITDFKDTLKLSYVRPLLFFALSGFITIAVINNSLGGIFIIENFFDDYPVFVKFIEPNLKDFKLSTSVALMVPLVLIVALYAKFHQLSLQVVGKRSSYRQHLSICCYIAGSLFIAEFISKISEMHLWISWSVEFENLVDSTIRPIVAFIGMGTAGVLAVLTLARYFQFNRDTFQLRWGSTFGFTLLNFIGFILFGALVMFLFEPFFSVIETTE